LSFPFILWVVLSVSLPRKSTWVSHHRTWKNCMLLVRNGLSFEEHWFLWYFFLEFLFSNVHFYPSSFHFYINILHLFSLFITLLTFCLISRRLFNLGWVFCLFPYLSRLWRSSLIGEFFKVISCVSSYYRCPEFVLGKGWFGLPGYFTEGSVFHLFYNQAKIHSISKMFFKVQPISFLLKSCHRTYNNPIYNGVHSICFRENDRLYGVELFCLLADKSISIA
jgi:hypothetical protein